MATKKRNATWSQKMSQTRQMRSEGASLLYDRVKLYEEIYEDDEYRDNCLAREVNPEDELDHECADTCCTFLELLAVMESFPRQSQWTGGHLKVMLAETLAVQSRSTTAARAKRNTKNWKEIAAEREREIVALREQLAVANGKIEELERLFDKVRAA